MNEKIIIFSLGITARAIYRKLKAEGRNVIAFVDNKITETSTYDGLPVYSPKDLVILDFDKIAYGGIWAQEIEKQLTNELNIDKKKIMFLDDNIIEYTTSSRAELTDEILKIFSTISQKLSIIYYVIGSSLATLFRKKDLSVVADVDLFITSQKEAQTILDYIKSNALLTKFSIETIYYKHDEVLATKGEIKKFIIKSKVDKNEEPAIVDISVSHSLGDKFIVRHDELFIYIPQTMCDGERYIEYKDFNLRIPYLAEDYLSLLYGKDWITPPKKWSQCDYGNLLTSKEVQDLKEKFSNKTIITYGTFDMFHIGHLKLLQRLKKLGTKLIVAVSTDEFNQLKGKKTLIPFQQRALIVENIKCVDLVIAENGWEQKIDDIKKYNVDIFSIGDDWKEKFDFLQEYCEVIYLPRTKNISSTQLKIALNLFLQKQEAGFGV